SLNQVAKELDKLTRDMEQHPQQLSNDMLRQGLQTMQQLMEHYFQVQHPENGGQMHRVDPHSRDGIQGWRSLDELTHLIAA
ncbi:DUF2813 domain-containing protein, partial [Pantoea allii]|uniref:DUF2813 domain-containing protein n=1 Tax=Pantoea allii TaxID=574096 RepID=UPI003D312819